MPSISFANFRVNRIRMELRELLATMEGWLGHWQNTRPRTQGSNVVVLRRIACRRNDLGRRATAWLEHAQPSEVNSRARRALELWIHHYQQTVIDDSKYEAENKRGCKSVPVPEQAEHSWRNRTGLRLHWTL